MRTEIHFRHMERTDALENYARDKIVTTVDEFLKREDYHVQIWLDLEHDRHAGGADVCKCEVDIRYPHKKELFLENRAEDMYVAIDEIAKKLKVTLRNASEKELKNKRHPH